MLEGRPVAVIGAGLVAPDGDVFAQAAWMFASTMWNPDATEWASL